MRKVNNHRFNQSGDTIVEVLFCMATIALVMVATYVTINSSYLRFEDSRERSQAVNLASSQIEDLRYYTSFYGVGGLPASPYCFYLPTGSNLIYTANSSNSNCTQTSNGSPSTATPAYKISINVVNAPTYSVKVNITWQGFRQQEQAFLEYRLQ